VIHALVFGLFALAQLLAPNASSVTPVIENERVTVRTVTFLPGQSAEGNRGEDSVTVFITAGTLSTPQGTITRRPGDVAYHPKGPRVREEVVGNPVRAMIVGLHDVTVSPLQNTSGYPEAFPRPGAKKILENDRVTVWDYTFTPGQPSPMHFHSRDTVVLYTDDGAVTSTTPEGVSTVVEHPPGHITYSLRNRTHTEVVSRGNVHIIVTELK
jgi:quercetin dioxygenase-like cupin family protein